MHSSPDAWHGELPTVVSQLSHDHLDLRPCSRSGAQEILAQLEHHGGWPAFRQHLGQQLHGLPSANAQPDQSECAATSKCGHIASDLTADSDWAALRLRTASQQQLDRQENAPKFTICPPYPLCQACTQAWHHGTWTEMTNFVAVGPQHKPQQQLIKLHCRLALHKLEHG